VRRSWRSRNGRRPLRARQIETEAAPIRYVAAVFDVADQEATGIWLIALVVLCCDRLAIVLTAAALSQR
jgi:hypothetical protein